MLTRLSIRLRLTLFGLAAVLVLLGVGAMNYWQTTQLSDALTRAVIGQTKIRNIGEVDMMHDAIRGDVLDLFYQINSPDRHADETKAKTVRTAFADHSKILQARLASNQALPQNEEERRLIAALEPVVAAYIQGAKTMMNALTEGRDMSQAMTDFETRFLSLEKSLAALSNALEAHGQADQAAAEQVAHSAGRNTLMGLGLSLLLLVVVAYSLSQSIVRPLHHIRDFLLHLGTDLQQRLNLTGQDEISSMGRAIDAMLTRQADTVRLIQHAADTLHTTASTLLGQSGEANRSGRDIADTMSALTAGAEQMRAGVASVATAIGDNARAVADASQASLKAETAMQQSRQAGADQAQATRALGSTMDELNQAVSRIGMVAGVIRDIADQTNLLALNAAIEAARAGEMGRGFAVVADEVRKLAERTTSSTADINTIIQAIHVSTEHAAQSMMALSEQVDEGLVVLDTAREAQSTITAQIQSIHQVADEVANATRQQAVAIDDTTVGMAHIESNLAGLQQVMDRLNTSAHTLDREAGSLAKHAADFKTERR